jgi:predicted MFS family arabinose efflux permease
MVLFGVTGVALTGFFIGFSSSFVTLVIFLAVSAIMGGGYHPASTAAISLLVPSEYRGRALGIHTIGGGSSFWMVPLLAAPIAVAWGWRNSFLTLTIPIVILGIVLFILIGRHWQAHLGDSHEAGGEVGTTKVEKETMITPVHIRWRQIAPFIIISVVTGTMIESVSAYLSLHAVDGLGISEATAARLMAVSPGVGLLVAPFGGYLSDRFGGIPVLMAVSFLAVILIYLLSVASGAIALAAIMAAIGFVTFTRMPTSESYIAGNTPPHRRATILSLYFFAGMEAPGLLVPVIGILSDRVGFNSTFTITAVAMGAILVVTSLFLWQNRT